MPHVIAPPCIGVKDTACVDACPCDVIHPHRDDAGFADTPQLYIDARTCIDCGACIPVCPVEAIFLAEDLPADWRHCARENAAWFDGTLPGGSP